MKNISAEDALERLKAGNARFVAGDSSGDPARRAAARSALVDGQRPFAVILGCSDSRVPAEMVFDQGLGDLFVIRVAGNVVERSQIGSVEFAAAQFGTRLVLVMGHTQCGAVQATLEHLRRPAPAPSPNLGAIVDHIRPAVESLVATGHGAGELERDAVRANIRYAAERLRHGSPLLESLVTDDGLVIAAAEYDLKSGHVALLD